MADLAKLYSIEKIFGEVSHQPTAVSGLGVSRIYVFRIRYRWWLLHLRSLEALQRVDSAFLQRVDSACEDTQAVAPMRE